MVLCVYTQTNRLLIGRSQGLVHARDSLALKLQKLVYCFHRDHNSKFLFLWDLKSPLKNTNHRQCYLVKSLSTGINF